MTLPILHHLLLLHLLHQHLLLPLLLTSLVHLALALSLFLLGRDLGYNSLLLVSILDLTLSVQLAIILHLAVGELVCEGQLVVWGTSDLVLLS